MSGEQKQIEATISALEAQRATLGDAVVETALASLRAKLAALGPPSDDASGQIRKQATILFLDIVGSTMMSRDLDPEEIGVVMDGALAHFTRIIEAHRGKVFKYAGDSMLAVFGADDASEDDPERAVRSGLALLDAAKQQADLVKRQHAVVGFDVRVGVHTGGVLFGGGVDAEESVRGHAVNVAARMEQTAPPGRLRISQDTYRHVRGVFDVELQPPLAVKGVEGTLTTYLVQRAKPRAFRVATRGIEGVETRMIGRDAELKQLVSVLDRVVSSRRLHAVTVVGDPGWGKSRILRELQGVLETRSENFWLLLGRTDPQSHLRPYGLLRDLLAWRLEIADSDTGAIAKAKLMDGLLPWLGDRSEFKAHLIGNLIGLSFADSPHLHGLDARQLRDLAFSALRDYLQGLTVDGSVVAMLLEDLHWADEGSLDFIAELHHGAADLPLVVVATTRPELLERKPGWTDSSAAHEVMHLHSLDADNGDVLARELLKRVDGDAQRVRELLIAHADGNPFYMEELLRVFLDDEVIVSTGNRWQIRADKLREFRVPTTLVGVLQARLDALSAADRLALQQASIVGHVFWDNALATLDERALASIPALRGRSLIVHHQNSAFEGTSEEAFHHHLLHQVTYETVLKSARRAGHARVAGWLAERVGDRPAEYLAITAMHYERAGDDAQAFDYFDRAAHDARGRYANQAALDYAERALRLSGATDLRRRFRLHALQKDVADLMGQRALQDSALAESWRIADALDDDSLRADVLFGKALLASRRGDETLALQLARQSADIAKCSGNAKARALALAQIAWSLHSKGEGEAALGYAQDAVASVREALQREDTPQRRMVEVQTLTLLALIEREEAPDNQQAKNHLLEALTLARALDLRRPQATVLEMLASLEMDAGRYTSALAYLEQALAVASECGWRIFIAGIREKIAECYLETGSTDRSAEHLEAAEDEARRSENPFSEARCMLLRGRIEAAAGNPTTALTQFESALAVAKGIDVRTVLDLRARIAEIHLRAGRLTRALELTEELAQELDATKLTRLGGEFLYSSLVCHRVWAAADDPRAAHALKMAHDGLHALAERAGDEDTRRSILENVPLHREIGVAWTAHQTAGALDLGQHSPRTDG
jgi:predicted ATPase/class 3 adenylate cyclase